MRAFQNGVPVKLRHPRSVRPWQHVLEPLSGYLVLAERLMGEDGDRFAKGWNFGPSTTGQATVADVASISANEWGSGARVEIEQGEYPVESETLVLDSSSARTELDWAPRWSLTESIKRTVAWHRGWALRGDMLETSLGEIHAYEAAGS
jgi:CDP-glucose 4,6-dehydratase